MSAVMIDGDRSKALRTKDIGVVAKANTDRNRWFGVCVALVCFLVIQMYYLNVANERAEKNTEVIWMKMYPNGTWDVSNIKPGNVQEFFNATVDKLLSEYAINRYGITPATIRRDYGVALQFMSPQVAGGFTSDKGFNAAGKAADVLSQPSHNTKRIEVGVIDHYDKSSAMFGKVAGEVMRTNMYLVETVVSNIGAQVEEPKRYILSIHWRIQSPDELKSKPVEYFRVNPIGLEVVQEILYLDPAFIENKGV